jgi:hypothetical protein
VRFLHGMPFDMEEYLLLIDDQLTSGIVLPFRCFGKICNENEDASLLLPPQRLSSFGLSINGSANTTSQSPLYSWNAHDISLDAKGSSSGRRVQSSNIKLNQSAAFVAGSRADREVSFPSSHHPENSSFFS